MNVDIGKGTTYYTSPKLEENKWYNYEIMQKEVYFCSVKSLACTSQFLKCKIFYNSQAQIFLKKINQLN